MPVIDLASLPPRETLVALVGPTGVGKTAFAVGLAASARIEIVSADSRQVYRYMDIGTAKPTEAERAAVRHHLVDVADPDETFTLTGYQAAAQSAIAEIQARGVLPMLVGGTGLYVRAVTEGLSIPRVAPDQCFRAEMTAKAADSGPAWLEAQVRAVDPVTADRERANPRRLIRALEVYRATGQPLSMLQTSQPPPYRVVRVGLTMERRRLYERVDQRVDAMLDLGLVAEVRSLHARGYGWNLPAMSGLGYRQIGEYLRGECDLPAAIQRIKHATHAFIRHQYAWFRLSDRRICWLDAGSGFSPVDAL